MWIMDDNPAIQCDVPGGANRRMRAAAAVTIVLYIAGLPITIAVFLWRNWGAVKVDQTLREKEQGDSSVTNPYYQVCALQLHTVSSSVIQCHPVSCSVMQCTVAAAAALGRLVGAPTPVHGGVAHTKRSRVPVVLPVTNCCLCRPLCKRAPTLPSWSCVLRQMRSRYRKFYGDFRPQFVFWRLVILMVCTREHAG